MTMPAALAEAISQAPPAAPTDKLAALRAKCIELRDAELEQANTEEKLAELKAQLVKLRHEVLPDLMDEAGTDKIGLPGAGNVKSYDALLEPYYRANIAAEQRPGSEKGWPAQRRQQAFNTLIEESAEDLIKHTFTIQFGRGEEEQAHSLAELLKAEGFEYSEGADVHWMTLTAWVKERFQNDVPLSAATLDAIGATVGRIVKLKPRKEK